MHVTQLQLAMIHHRKHKRIKLLGFMMGAYDTEAPPVLAIRDTNFLWKILDYMRRQNEFTDALLQDKDMQIDMTKAKVQQCVKAIFEPILPDSAVNLLHRISLMPPPSESKNPKKIDFGEPTPPNPPTSPLDRLGTSSPHKPTTTYHNNNPHTTTTTITTPTTTTRRSVHGAGAALARRERDVEAAPERALRHAL